MEPISASAIFAGINSAFKFAEFAVRIAEVGTENEVFVRMIQVVREDLNETERLLNEPSVKARLTSTPGKIPWVRSALNSTKSCLNDIGKWVERVRVDQQTRGEVRFETRVRWVFNDHEKLLNRKMELSTCHQQLSNVLGYLMRLEDVAPTIEPPSYRDTTSLDDFVSPRQKRKNVATSLTVAAKEDEKRQDLLRLTTQTPSTEVTTNFASLSVTSPSLSSLASNPVQAKDVQVRESNFPRSTTKMCHRQSLTSRPIISPKSPPPSYTKAIQPNYVRVEWSDTMQDTEGISEQNTKLPHQNIHTNASATQTRHCSIGKEKHRQEVNVFKADGSIPELCGDMPELSATNFSGPVNPFELCAEPTQLKRPTIDGTDSNVSNKKHRVTADLPASSTAFKSPSANVIGPPPGYPPLRHSVTIPEPPSNATGRKPTLSTANSEPTVSILELPAFQENIFHCKHNRPPNPISPQNQGAATKILPEVVPPQTNKVSHLSPHTGSRPSGSSRMRSQKSMMNLLENLRN